MEKLLIKSNGQWVLESLNKAWGSPTYDYTNLRHNPLTEEQHAESLKSVMDHIEEHKYPTKVMPHIETGKPETHVLIHRGVSGENDPDYPELDMKPDASGQNMIF